MIAVLAIDGGQSGIRMRHSGSTRVVEVDGVTRSADTVAAVATAVSEAWTAGNFAPVDRVMLGLTTAPGREEDADRLCGLVAAATDAREIWLADDTVTAHSGGLAGEPGVCLVAGTGVACLAVGRQGAPRSFDGHGYLLGDEGGAFWIGRRALRLALRNHDRRLGGSLTELAQARFGTIDGLHIRLHEAESPVNEIAQFARDVIEAARIDKAAGLVIDEAARRLLSTTLDAVGTIHEPTVALALGGRLLEEGTALRDKLDVLLAGHERIRPQSAIGTPLDGALRLGGSDSPGQYGGLVHEWRKERAA